MPKGKNKTEKTDFFRFESMASALNMLLPFSDALGSEEDDNCC